MKHYKIFTIIGISATSLPFLLLLANIDPSLQTLSPTLFWNSVTLTLGSMFGFVGTVWCVWSLILGTRFISRYITRDMLWMNKIHKTLGIYGATFILIHPLLETYAYGQGVLYSLIPSLSSSFETHVTYGRLAFMAFILVWVTSALVRGKIRYRPWLYIHYLSYPMLVLSFLHAREIGTTLNAHPLLLLLWNMLFVVVIIVSCLRIAIAGGFLQPRYRVAAIHRVGPSTVVKLTPLGKRIIPIPGQFAYLQLRGFGESHPFSVMEYLEKDGSLVFGVKAFGKFSGKFNGLQTGATVMIDGPYGMFTREGHSSAPKVLIAGLGNPSVTVCAGSSAPTGYVSNSSDLNDAGAGSGATVSSFTGASNGQISITYSDDSTVLYPVFTLTSSSLTQVKQYGTSDYVFVLHPKGKKIALVNALTGEVVKTVTLSKKAKYTKNSLKVIDVRNNGVLDIVVTSQKGGKVLLTLLKFNLDSIKLTKKSAQKLTGASTVQVGKTKSPKKTIVLRNKKKHVLYTFTVTKKFKMKPVM